MGFESLKDRLRRVTGPVVDALRNSGREQLQLLENGADFPEFCLRDQFNNWISNEAMRGDHAVLCFIANLNDPDCAKQARGLRKRSDVFEACGVEVYGVSFENPRAHSAFAERNDLHFSLLSDTKRELARQLGAVGKGERQPRSVSYFLDPSLRVLQAFQEFDLAGHADQLLSAVKQHKR